MDYKKTAIYRIGLASTAVGVSLFLVNVVQRYVADLSLGSFAFLAQPQVPFCFLLVGVLLTTMARRRGAREEADDQGES